MGENVKRFANDRNPNGLGYSNGVVEDEHGHYVLHSDYEALARQAEALQQEVDSLKQTRQHSREASAALHDAFMEERKRVEALQRENAEFAKAVLEVLNAVRDYLPPDGISAGDCLSRVIGAVDNSGINPLIKKLEHADVDA